MTCPHCAHFHETTLPALKDKYIDTGKARLILREFPFDPRADGRLHAGAAAPNDNYFPMVDVLFKQQQNWASVEDAQGALLQISKLAGFSQESFEACLTDQKLLEDVRAVQEAGSRTSSRVDCYPDLLHQREPYKGPCRLTKCRRSSTACSEACALRGRRRRFPLALRVGAR